MAIVVGQGTSRGSLLLSWIVVITSQVASLLPGVPPAVLYLPERETPLFGLHHSLPALLIALPSFPSEFPAPCSVILGSRLRNYLLRG